ncbi:MAG: class I SAM-dependent RNA methyltransferase [Candidatus Omnitrophica bacterium]|nr:class I SAM-dependent RNA methyltransferase [Candidatus Omnitrophota bacterium]
MAEGKMEPLCPVFGECGGCTYQNISYQEELAVKNKQLQDLIEERLSVQKDIVLPVQASPEFYHYRHRIDLKLIKTRSKDIFIGFTPVSGRGVLPVEQCPIARREISDYIPTLKKEVQEKLPDKYRMANLTVRSGDAKKVLWGGIGRRSLQLTPDNYFWTEINGRRIYYSLDTFFQANLFILPALFDFIRSLDIWTDQSLFLDLYGGVGLFGFGLADYCRKVVLIEENPASVRLAHYNLNQHQLRHVDIIEGRVEDHIQKVWDKYSAFSRRIAMIDPPRAGLSAEAAEFMVNMKELDYLMYLSCHPEALMRDLKIFIANGWTIETIKPFDFFPRTKHLETLVVLKS